MPGPGIITVMHYKRREIETFLSSKGIQLPNILKNGMNAKWTVVFVISPAVSGDFICVAPSESLILISMWRLDVLGFCFSCLRWLGDNASGLPCSLVFQLTTAFLLFLSSLEHYSCKASVCPLLPALSSGSYFPISSLCLQIYQQLQLVTPFTPCICSQC